MSDSSEIRSSRRLWGRAQGRPLSKHQTALVANLLPKISIPQNMENPLEVLSGFSHINLEIGFGGAEHLLHRAARDPDIGYIGVEPFLNGVGKALAGIEKHKLKNIRLHHGDVRVILDNMPNSGLDNIYILFPDPWPKPRHFKRRLISDELVGELYRVLKPGGRLYFASDILSYIDWALIRILRFRDNQGTGFHWPAETSDDWMRPYPDWPGTRYEAKAFREGRTPHYFTFEKQLK
jgi:tRNA (guanine-N7-)-methyltransferase